MDPASDRKRDEPGAELTRWLGCAAVAAFYLVVVRGYRMYSGDQRQYFLLPFRQMSEDFIPRDWLTWDTSHYHYVFAWFVRAADWLASTAGFSFEAVIFGAYALLLVVLFRAILSVVNAFGGGGPEFLLTLLLMFGYAEAPTRGPGDSFLLPSGYLVPSGLAAAAFVWSLSVLWQGRWTAAFFLLGIAGLIHVNFGMAGLPIVAVLYLLRRGELGTPAELFRFGCAFGVPFSITFVPTLAGFAGAQPSDSTVQISDILRLAAPGHYVASTWTVAKVLVAFVPLLGGTWLILDRPEHAGARRALISSGVIFAGIYVVQLAGSTFVARLFFWRVFPCLQMLGFVVIARQALAPGGRNRTAFGASILAYLVLSWVRDRDLGPEDLAHLPRAIAVVSGAAVLVLASAVVRRVLATRPLVARAILVLVAVVAAYPAIYLQRGYGRPHFYVHQRDPLSTWLADNTPSDALLLTPPLLGGLRVTARRAIVVSAGQFPVGKPGEMAAWLARLSDCSGVEDLGALAGRDNIGQRLHARFLELRGPAIERAMRKYGADYFVTVDEHVRLDALSEDARLEIVGRVDGYVVFALRE